MSTNCKLQIKQVKVDSRNFKQQFIMGVIEIYFSVLNFYFGLASEGTSFLWMHTLDPKVTLTA